MLEDIFFCYDDLFIGSVDEFVSSRLPHGQTQTVDGVQCSTQEAAQTQLFPAEQPLVQPRRESSIFGSSPQLDDGGHHTRQVDQGQHHQSHAGQCYVHRVNGQFVEHVLTLGDVRVQDVPDEVVEVKEDEEEKQTEDRDVPGRKEMEGKVLNVQS